MNEQSEDYGKLAQYCDSLESSLDGIKQERNEAQMSLDRVERMIDILESALAEKDAEMEQLSKAAAWQTGELRRQCDDAQSELSALREKHRWHKTSEELPEKGEEVLGYDSRHDIHSAVLFTNRKSGLEVWLTENSEYYSDISIYDYWRPLDRPEVQE